jgi:hypothetical protein
VISVPKILICVPMMVSKKGMGDQGRVVRAQSTAAEVRRLRASKDASVTPAKLAKAEETYHQVVRCSAPACLWLCAYVHACV